MENDGYKSIEELNCENISRHLAEAMASGNMQRIEIEKEALAVQLEAIRNSRRVLYEKFAPNLLD